MWQKPKLRGLSRKIGAIMNLLQAGSHHRAHTECGFNQWCYINRERDNKICKIDLFLCSFLFFFL